METKHNTPWVGDRARTQTHIKDASGELICSVWDADQAEFILRACNSHDKLLEALPDPDKLETLADWFDLEQGRRPDWVGNDVQTDLRNWATKARAAIAAAEPKPGTPA
jgi:hypothetical protein